MLISVLLLAVTRLRLCTMPASDSSGPGHSLHQVDSNSLAIAKPARKERSGKATERRVGRHRVGESHLGAGVTSWLTAPAQPPCGWALLAPRSHFELCLIIVKHTQHH